MIHSLDHVALSVTNMPRAVKFYRDIIGMAVVMEIEFLDDRISKITGIPGAKCKVVHLKLGHTVLELFQYYNPKGKSIPAKFRQCDNGFTHIGFCVTDIYKHIKQLKKHKIKFLGKLTEARPGVFVIYFRGPDNEVCEFRQLP